MGRINFPRCKGEEQIPVHTVRRGKPNQANSETIYNKKGVASERKEGRGDQESNPGCGTNDEWK